MSTVIKKTSKCQHQGGRRGTKGKKENKKRLKAKSFRANGDSVPSSFFVLSFLDASRIVRVPRHSDFRIDFAGLDEDRFSSFLLVQNLGSLQRLLKTVAILLVDCA